MIVKLQVPTASLTGADSLTGAAAKPSKLHEAAQQFESLMINEMMKTVKESSSSGWMGSEEDSASESAMDMAQTQFAAALAKSGGLGLTKMIEKSVGTQSTSHA